MKTIAFNKSRGSLITTLAVLGGLTAFYFYRRQGGRVTPLLKAGAQKGMDIVSGRTDLKSAASDVISQVSEQAAPLAKKVSSRVANRASASLS